MILLFLQWMLLQTYQTKSKLMIVRVLNQLPFVKVLLLLKIFNTIKRDIGKINQKTQLMPVNSQLLKDQFQIILQTAPILLIYFLITLIYKLLITFYIKSSFNITQKLPRTKPIDWRAFISFFWYKHIDGILSIAIWEIFLV